MPMSGYRPAARAAGFGLIEVLVAVFIMLFSLVALAGLLSRTHAAEFESYQRKQAVILLEDLLGRLSANPNAAACYAVTTNGAAGTPYLGTGSALAPACAVGAGTPALPSAEAAARALADLAEWHALLRGGAEVVGPRQLGGALDARGCIVNDGAVAGFPGATQYTVSVAWRGASALAQPGGASSCAQGSYDADDRLRRAVSATVRIGVLN